MNITPEIYRANCKRRFGTANPELVDAPVWEWMVRTGQSPYRAREQLGLKLEHSSCDVPRNPDWCFQRMGAASVALPDGRQVFIAGEYEDWYDPDFCIYNDVIVRRGEAVEIYAYPRELFPPTDFHTATLVEDTVWIIGSLGYPEERGGPDTQVFALDPASYRIRRVAGSGISPGWLHKHRAKLRPDGAVIEVWGGQSVSARKDEEVWRTNLDVFALDTRTGVWSKESDRSSWREFRVHYSEEIGNLTSNLTLGWYTGEILRETGYPVEAAPDGDDLEEGDDRVHTLTVRGVQVRVSDHFRELHVIIEGVLPGEATDELMTKLKRLLESTNRQVTKVDAC